MLDSVYSSVNRAIARAWEAIAPGVPVVYGHPAPPETLPSECLRLYWLDYGGETAQGGQLSSLVQVDIFTPDGKVALALRRAAALAGAMNLGANAGGGRIGVYAPGGDRIGYARVTPLEAGWQNGEDPDPRLVILSRTIQVVSTPVIR